MTSSCSGAQMIDHSLISFSCSETADNATARQITSPEYGKSRKAIKEYEKAVENEARVSSDEKNETLFIEINFNPNFNPLSCYFKTKTNF